MRPLTAILAVLTGVAGWFYLFYSKAATGLGGIEHQQPNLRRVRLRRINGFVMIILAALLYVGTYATDEHAHPAVFVGAWLGVTALLGVVVLLVLADVRLTLRLREQLGRRATSEKPGAFSSHDSSAPTIEAGDPVEPDPPADPNNSSNPRTPP